MVYDSPCKCQEDFQRISLVLFDLSLEAVSLRALFTVEAPQSLYIVEHGNNVTMECTFPVNGKLKFKDLNVGWEKKDESKKQVYVLLKGEEDFTKQHSDFKGRIKLLKENLKLGQSLLQITDVKLRDAGFYQCIIGYGGADYKTISLEVKAPYRTITQRVVSTGDNEWKLMCQSEGHPQAEVIWKNREYEDLTDKANTSYETGSDQLYRVTSTLTIKSRIDEIFYCIFWNKELQENTSAILHITARVNKDHRTPVANSATAGPSKDTDAHDYRDASFEGKELKYPPEKMFHILTVMVLKTKLSMVSGERETAFQFYQQEQCSKYCYTASRWASAPPVTLE
ncbi:programmed cell death 1 ligand 1 [Amazona aestiva]|uniref:Programmed cell death 1 ligand 1 n=1 Tax=Amazona aestiva TaxID=12930 RepID=A0A0Q3SBJ4_AMAAE|nr:programmed cell death 1 ligand 1 [Amazona aestiva]